MGLVHDLVGDPRDPSRFQSVGDESIKTVTANGVTLPPPLYFSAPSSVTELVDLGELRKLGSIGSREDAQGTILRLLYVDLIKNRNLPKNPKLPPLARS